MSYPATSPYYLSDIVNNQYLDVMVPRTFYSDPTDIYWQITPTYNLRPDLLAYDLYSDSKLWWIFAQRNPNKLKDPLFDFVQGVSIYIPKQELLRAQLGI
jgi:hypothetical protein